MMAYFIGAFWSETIFWLTPPITKFHHTVSDGILHWCALEKNRSLVDFHLHPKIKEFHDTVETCLPHQYAGKVKDLLP